MPANPMTAREAVLKAAEIARQTARCPRNAVGVARDETSGWFSADQYREEGADAVADALSAFADTLPEGPQTERDAVVPEGCIECMHEASDILEGVRPMRGPIVDELWGFSLMLRDLAAAPAAAMSADSDRAKLEEGPQTERDAARYRWLQRRVDIYGFLNMPDDILDAFYDFDGNKLDQAIDAAMSADSDRAKLEEGPQAERDAAKGIKELDLDGLELTPGTTLIGKATKHDGEWRCLANWHGSMVVVALNITAADSDRAKNK